MTIDPLDTEISTINNPFYHLLDSCPAAWRSRLYCQIDLTDQCNCPTDNDNMYRWTLDGLCNFKHCMNYGKRANL
ncbi:hypothetical protein GYMLUDRAFT_46287 [Collybiopsis luxurians FD-317 M1]|uniref:Uncharacterized protein n=1 Tax=Collybiopsis luxurians FD-317 M1 TaxID=944289 RepID=A0A0D0CPW3_9AGAR|nr:hypothetical protein GYMLUDRAFT_46287 [Collybiopsis luxurians FD-317 M1]